jgi:hypothetical protein
MKSKWAFLAFAVAALTIHATAQAERARTGEYRLVGLSEEVFQGNGGIAAMHAACQATFGDRLARMCTSEEVFKTPNLQDLGLERSGWIQPIITGAGFSDAGEFIVDAYTAALSFSTTQSCNAWTSNQEGPFFGLTYNPRAGALENSPCINENPVACCSSQKSR